VTVKEFWRLHPKEFWWLFEANKPTKMYGSMTERDAGTLLKDLKKWQHKAKSAR